MCGGGGWRGDMSQCGCHTSASGPFRSGEDPGGRDCSLHHQEADPCVVHLRLVGCTATHAELQGLCHIGHGSLYMCGCI